MMHQASTSGVRAGAWGLLSGLVGSLCCIGPSAAVLLGLGSSSALLGLSLDHTLALAGGGALLLAGVLLALRRARACDMRPATRWRTLALMLATCAIAYGLLGLLLPALAARQEDASTIAFQPARAPAAAITLRRITLNVDQMTCPPCAAHIRALLKRKPFVRSFFAETNIDQVTIDYNSSQTTAKDVLALFPSYYGATIISDEAMRR
jgi:copper chaperone CopZ